MLLHHLVDARKRSCTDPINLLQSLFDEYRCGLIEILVDFVDEVKTIEDFSLDQGFECEVVEREDGFSVLLKRDQNFFLEVL
ncbi:sulfurtransferase TusA family protein [Alkalithermobacter paradoxus]|uniref:SirA-like protein n=1 Tax=Alkalithermobacter paradoxus TaxID=29349 RepID=A0A1V4IAT8_9FIRM|nr:hypothetical protein CLOTH_03150 [[Clostridium] thermoalcaliphilum]